MYRNPEHYPDPTAGAALCQLRRKENRLNTGKQFEAAGREDVKRYYQMMGKRVEEGKISPCRRMPGAIG